MYFTTLWSKEKEIDLFFQVRKTGSLLFAARKIWIPLFGR